MTSSKRRHLLAVMFTDVVGYTALMQRDEEACRIVRRRHRQVLEAAISAHGGDLQTLSFVSFISALTWPMKS